MSMLQRFSLSTFAQTIKGAASGHQTYKKEDIEHAIAEIKLMGKRAVNRQQQSDNANQTHVSVGQDIKSILKLMKQFESNLYVQRVSCHALSNLAMQVVIARYIVSNNGFQYIRNALEKFINDHKLCWLASSAIWNMARPPANREIIGKTGVKLMLKVLSIHFSKHEKVTNTAIGALSNLSLCESTKSLICKKQNITLILDVLRLYGTPQTKSISVMTSGAGLLANLAVSDEHAETLLQYNGLPVLVQLLQWQSEKKTNNEEEENEQENAVESTLHRNSCAALNNMVTAPDFISKVLECNGIEIIYTFIKQTENSLFINLLENCLTTLECDLQHPVTTMHLCGLHNKMDLLKQMILKASTIDDNTFNMDIDDDSESSRSSTDSSMTPSVGAHIWGNKVSDSFTVQELLNQTDGNSMTVLQYAALGKHYKLVQFLIKCGANADVLEKVDSQDESQQNDIKMHQTNIDNAVNNGKKTIETISSQHQAALEDTLQDFPTDLCRLIATFENPIDMLQEANQF